ncbi:MAG: hypothetical protein QGI33_00265 [Candidatus Brocadiia bacterium]|nr:hypothetical protein [Candidatus Brocadiia bacterium]
MSKGFSTRWLELSRSELRVLLIAAGVVLIFFIAVHLVRWAVWEPALEVSSARETLRPHLRCAPPVRTRTIPRG